MSLSAPCPTMPFVVGLSRSGTTLLRLMLDAHSQLAVPPETQFLTEITQLSATEKEARDRFFQTVRNDPRWTDFHLDEAQFRTALATVPADDLAGCVRAFYQLYAQKFGKPRVGDKTPLYLTCMDRIQRLLPEAKFVHIIRDGRDVAVSFREMWWGPGKDIAAQARLWVNRLGAARQQVVAPGAYLEIRYEDLVAQPEEVLRRVCAFFDLNYEPGMQEYHRSAAERLSELGAIELKSGERTIRAEDRRQIHSQNVLPVNDSRIARWKNELTREELDAYQAVAGELLQSLGYELA